MIVLLHAYYCKGIEFFFAGHGFAVPFQWRSTPWAEMITLGSGYDKSYNRKNNIHACLAVRTVSYQYFCMFPTNYVSPIAIVVDCHCGRLPSHSTGSNIVISRQYLAFVVVLDKTHQRRFPQALYSR